MDASFQRQRFEQRLNELMPSARVERMLRFGSGSRPDVAVIVIHGQKCVVKDHQGCDRWFAKLVGPILARREMRALRQLEGMVQVPKLVRVLDQRAFAMSWIDAKPYRQGVGLHDSWPKFFEVMETTVSEMHSRGVAHCDLRSPDNTLITPLGMPVIVDFVASFTRGPSWNPGSNWLFRRFCDVDRSAIDKQKRTVCPELLGLEEKGRRSEGMIDRLGRNFGVVVRHMARKLLTHSRKI